MGCKESNQTNKKSTTNITCLSDYPLLFIEPLQHRDKVGVRYALLRVAKKYTLICLHCFDILSSFKTRRIHTVKGNKKIQPQAQPSPFIYRSVLDT